MYLKESCFPDCWIVSLVIPVFKNVGERSTTNNYHPVGLLSVVGKVFEKCVNNRIVNHLENCGLFFISSMVLGLLNQLQIFWWLYLIELLGFLQVWGYLCCSTWYIQDFWQCLGAGLLHKLKSYEISGQIFGLISSFLSNRGLQVVLDERSSQVYPVSAGAPQGSILAPIIHKWPFWYCYL